jgi:hypothetical protein
MKIKVKFSYGLSQGMARLYTKLTGKSSDKFFQIGYYTDEYVDMDAEDAATILNAALKKMRETNDYSTEWNLVWSLSKGLGILDEVVRALSPFRNQHQNRKPILICI